MGSSLVLTGGAATAKTLKEAISLPSHGFTVGDVLRFNPSGVPKSYVKAQANSAENAEVLGIVNAVSDVNTFELTYGGYIDLPQFSGVSFPVMFLSGVCAGGLTSSPPSAVGTVVKPVVTRHPLLNGFVMNNYLGTQIGGSSTIGIDEIQPVGTIMPFAGNAIPDTWLECNGTSYDIASYTELYSKLCYTTGDRVPMYGYVFTVTTSTVNYVSGKTVSDIISNLNTANAGNAAFDGVFLRYGPIANPSLIAKILSVSGSGQNITMVCQVYPLYDSSTKKFSFPTITVPVGGVIASGTNGINGIGTVSTTGVYTENIVTEAVADTVRVTHFNSPNLRGRFILGRNTSFDSFPDFDSELASNNNVYGMAEFGGEEKHTLTEAELASHTHPVNGTSGGRLVINLGETGWVSRKIDGQDSASLRYDTTGWLTSVDVAGSNTPHNNMPPYLAVRYIIKAKPYTRAAIIDGVDLPYSNLLIRSTDSNSLRSELLSGASGGDLVFYTNSGETSKTGTERMRLTAGGTLGIGNAITSTSPNLIDYTNFLLKHNGNSEFAIVKADTTYPGPALRLYASRGTISSPSSILEGDELARMSGFGWQGTKYGPDTGNRHGSFLVYADQNFTTTQQGTGLQFEYTPRNTATRAEAMRFTSDGRLGIGTSTPGASLDVNGTLKVGDFGGATNVMPKVTRSAGVIGQVVPLLSYYNSVPTTPLNAGTWFVFFIGYDNSTSGTNEDPNYVHAKVWVVPSGYWLVFAPRGTRDSTTSNYDSGYAVRLTGSNSQANPVTETPTSFKDYVYLNNPNGHNTYMGNQDVTSDNVYTNTGGVGSAVGVGSTITGYAIRIA